MSVPPTSTPLPLHRWWPVAALAVAGVGLALVSPLAGGITLVAAAALTVAVRCMTGVNQRHEQLDVLQAFTRDLGAAMHDNEVLDTTLRSVVTYLGVQRSGLLLLATGDEAIRTVYEPGRGLRSLSISPDIAHRILSRFPTDPWSRLDFALGDDDLVELLGAEAGGGTAVRLGTASAPLGILIAGVRREDGRTIDADSVELLRVMSAHAGAAISNELLLARMRTQAEDREHRATHDQLTTLRNREGFRLALERSLGEVDRGRSVGVLVLDLHRFRDVNEALGLDAGDRFLRAIGERIAALAPEGAVVGRLGADEFGVVVVSERVRDAVAALSREISTSFRRPVVLGEVPVDVSASVGVAIAPDHGTDAGWLLRRADTALRRAVRSGQQVAVFDPHEDERQPAQLALVGELRAALDAGEVLPFFQPKLDVVTGRVVGAEALVRWAHPTKGLIPPDVFVPVAERTGLIGPLTDVVLQGAVAQVAEWNAAGHDVGVAVNISARSLGVDELAREVAICVHAAGIRPDQLTLEVTESTVMEASGRADTTLRRLDELGVRLSIDDFGTGYSSLSYLRSLPLSELKIDRSFVTRLPAEPEDQVIVRSTIDLAHTLGLRVVAEGVEDQETIALLAGMGCDTIQGYYTGRPVPAAELTARLETDRAAARNRGGDAAVLPLRRVSS